MALERHLAHLDVGLDAGDGLVVGDEANLGLDLERQRRQKLLQLARDVDRLEEAAQLLADDAEELVLRRRRLLNQIIRRILGQLEVAGYLAEALFAGEHRAE